MICFCSPWAKTLRVVPSGILHTTKWTCYWLWEVNSTWRDDCEPFLPVPELVHQPITPAWLTSNICFWSLWAEPVQSSAEGCSDPGHFTGLPLSYSVWENWPSSVEVPLPVSLIAQAVPSNQTTSMQCADPVLETDLMSGKEEHRNILFSLPITYAIRDKSTGRSNSTSCHIFTVQSYVCLFQNKCCWGKWDFHPGKCTPLWP